MLALLVGASHFGGTVLELTFQINQLPNEDLEEMGKIQTVMEKGEWKYFQNLLMEVKYESKFPRSKLCDLVGRMKNKRGRQIEERTS